MQFCILSFIFFYFNLNKYQQIVIFLEEYWSDRVSPNFARMTNRHKYYLVTHLRVSIIRLPYYSKIRGGQFRFQGGIAWAMNNRRVAQKISVIM